MKIISITETFKTLYQKLSESQNNLAVIWKAVQEILDLKSNKSNVISQIKNKSDECISDPNEISNKLNSYFSNVGLNLAKNMPDIITYIGCSYS